MNILTRKLECFGPLPEEDKRLLDDVISRPRSVPARTDLVTEGDASDYVHLILEGFACRYKLDWDGGRQIMAYLIPGDFGDLHTFILKAMDHTVATLSPCRVVEIPRARILELTTRPSITRALWWATLVDEATLREWIVNVGHREGARRVAHLMCELLLRLDAVGLTNGNSYPLPITQAELGDTVGFTTVHVNRSLKALKDARLITLENQRLVILDVHRLRQYAGFEPNYLHLAGGRVGT